jgi:hypothetical protein
MVSLKTITDAINFIDQASEIESLIAEKGGDREAVIKSCLQLRKEARNANSYIPALMEIGCFFSFELACNLRLLVMTLRGDSPNFDTLYRLFTNSSGRELELPSPLLNSVQRALRAFLPQLLKVHDTAHAYIRGRSQFTNANPHVGQEMVATIDVKSFFSSITREMIASAFKEGPCYHLSDQTIHLLAALTSRKGRLPVGASCSPFIANAVMYAIDQTISALSNRLHVVYTRFADDLTFSGTEPAVRDIVNVASALLRESGFAVNDSKTRFMGSAQRQIVTGIVVNVRLSTPLKSRKKLRAMHHYFQSGRTPFDGRREVSEASLCSKLGHVGKLHPDWLERLRSKPNSK